LRKPGYREPFASLSNRDDYLTAMAVQTFLPPQNSSMGMIAPSPEKRHFALFIRDDQSFTIYQKR
jgi:hypothetical protein